MILGAVWVTDTWVAARLPDVPCSNAVTIEELLGPEDGPYRLPSWSYPLITR